MPNVPIGDDLSVTQLIEEANEADKVSPEQIALAKIGNSADWKLVTDYLNQRIEIYKQGLFGEDLKGMDYALIGQRFLAAQTVIHEFEALKEEIDTVTQAVNNAKSKVS